MKLTIFGSTGPTGQELVKQGLTKEYAVSTLVRRPLDNTDTRLTVVQGDLFDTETVKRVIRDSDAVLSVLGASPKLFGQKTTPIYSKSAAVLVKVMTELGVKRLIFCTSAGVEDDPGEIWLYKHILKPLVLQPSYDDMKLGEQRIAQSDLDWTIVRPARLTNGALTTRFRVSKRFRPEGGTAISRADLASFMLNQVSSTEWVHQTPTLAY